MPEYSYLVRSGQMEKIEALKALEYKHDEKQAKLELKKLCQYADISYHKVMLKAFLYKRRWW